MLVANLKTVWAQTIMPDPPIANQSFTVSIPGPTPGVLYVKNAFGCVGGSVVFSGFIGPPSFSVNVPGQPAGQYSAFVGTVTDCVDFTVVLT
jgi:hypothetical protein